LRRSLEAEFVLAALSGGLACVTEFSSLPCVIGGAWLMIERGFLDPIPFWPFALWPIIGSTILFTYFQLNKAVQAEGRLVVDMYHPWFLPVLGVTSIVGSVYETLLAIFCLYTMGWLYLLFIPTVAILSFPTQIAFGLFPLATT
jgi:hypothetical protein